MNKSENKFTDKFALSSQNVHPRCELVVNQNASYALIYSNMSVNLRNKQGMMQSLQFNVTNSGFVRHNYRRAPALISESQIKSQL